MLTTERLQSVRVAQKQLLDLGDEKTAATLAWAREPAVETRAAGADSWYCEEHPDKEMRHNGCKGVGVPASGQGPLLAHYLRLARQEARESHMYRDDLIRQLTAALKDLRADAPVTEDGDEPVPSRGTDAIVSAWNDLPNHLRLAPELVKVFEAVKTCRDVDAPAPVAEPVALTDGQIDALNPYKHSRGSAAIWRNGFDVAMCYRPPAPEEGKDAARDVLALAIINAARTAMDESVEAENDAKDIVIPSHWAASLSLCLDEYDAAMAQGEPR